jgi:lysophospholipase L1-like esterase
LTEYKRDFAELLKLSIDLANQQYNKVLVLSIPDWGVSPFASDRDAAKITNQIMAFNQVAQKICLANKVAFVDILPMSRLGLDNRSMIADDDLHFSGKMYGLWAKEAYQVVQKMF